MVKLSYDDVFTLLHALQDISGYLSDNSCGDPDCCGGPYYTVEAVADAVIVLNEFGLDFKL